MRKEKSIHLLIFQNIFRVWPRQKNRPLVSGVLVACGIVFVALLPSCSNVKNCDNTTPAIETEFTNIRANNSVPGTVMEVNKTLINLNVDQLRTFYNAEGIPFRVLITSEMIAGINRMRISILDDRNNYIMGVEPYEDGPCVYYESFINMDYFDANADGKEDIEITARYMSGVGATGAIPQVYCITYLQSENGYFADEDIRCVDDPADKKGRQGDDSSGRQGDGSSVLIKAQKGDDIPPNSEIGK